MESWFSYRLATILAVSFLLVSSVQFYRTMDGSGEQWDVRLVADSYAQQINSFLIMEEDLETVIEHPEGLDGALILSMSLVWYEHDDTRWTSNLVRTVHLWEYKDNFSSQEKFDQNDANVSALLVNSPLFLAVKNVKIDGVTSREAFVFIREGT